MCLRREDIALERYSLYCPRYVDSLSQYLKIKKRKRKKEGNVFVYLKVDCYNERKIWWGVKLRHNVVNW